MSPRIAIGALVAALLISGCQSAGGSTQLSGMIRTPTPTIEVPAGTVTDTGAPVAFEAPAGGLALVYFGYTNCPTSARPPSPICGAP